MVASATRSGRVESVHRGAVAVVGPGGRLVAGAGAYDQVFYYRSACKPMQLVPVVEAGVVETFGLDDRHLAVMMSSHTGAPRHVAAVRDILGAIGLTTDALGCGFHEPQNAESRRLLATTPERRSALYNNCSGKHAAMLALSVALEVTAESYLDPRHPAQARIIDCVADYAGIPLNDAHLGTDGCSAPTLYAPLWAMAAAFARYAAHMTESGSAPQRIGQAAARCPEMLGEEEDFQVILERVLGERLIGKYGAEALFCLAVPAQGLGIAVRIEDGGRRAVAPVVCDLLAQLDVVADDEWGTLLEFREPVLHNWRGVEVGRLRSELVLSSMDAALG